MITRQHHRVAQLGGVALAAVLLAGCVGTSPAAPGTETPASGAAGEVAGNVTWWAWNAFDYEGTIAAFEKAHPGVTVDYKQYSYNDYVTAIRTGLTSSDGPDVFQVQAGELVTNLGPLAEPLEGHMAEEFGADWQAKFYDQGLAQLRLGDAQVALPAYMSAGGFIYYNADILEAAGVEVPATFDEWQVVCDTVTQTGIDCLAHGAKDAWVNLDVYLSIINSIAPGAVYDAIDGERSWTDPEFVEAMDAWQSLFTSGIVPKGATAMAEYPDAFSSFLEKKAAFIALGTWNTPGTMTNLGIVESQKTVTETIDSVYLSAPFPAARADGEPTAPFGGPDNGYSVSARSQNKAAALAFIDFLTVGEGQKIQASGGNIPGVVDVKVATDDVVDPRQVADIEGQQASLNNLVGPRQIVHPELSAALGDALSAVAAGTQSSADALALVETVSASLTR